MGSDHLNKNNLKTNSIVDSGSSIGLTTGITTALTTIDTSDHDVVQNDLEQKKSKLCGHNAIKIKATSGLKARIRRDTYKSANNQAENTGFLPKPIVTPHSRPRIKISFCQHLSVWYLLLRCFLLFLLMEGPDMISCHAFGSLSYQFCQRQRHAPNNDGKIRLRTWRTISMINDISKTTAEEALEAATVTAHDTTIRSYHTPPPLTSALLRISYDGRGFTGWSAGNDPKMVPPFNESTNAGVLEPSPTAKQSPTTNRRSRRQRSRAEPPHNSKGFVRSVEGVLRFHLAKLYRNLDPDLIVVEGCSRTDKGVHARSMVALVYGLDSSKKQHASSSLITGKRLPHPANSTDSTAFLPIPMQQLSKLACTLNRMLPPDVRIAGIAPIPNPVNNIPHVFHPSVSAITKTYAYTFSVGGSDESDHVEGHTTASSMTIPDPTVRGWVWHVPTSPTTTHSFDMDKAQEACRILQGTHNFGCFQGAPRGASGRQKRKQAPMEDFLCTIKSISIKKLPMDLQGERRPTFVVEVTGDRFLYKMVRFLVGSIVGVGVGGGHVHLEDLQTALSTTTSGSPKRDKVKPLPCAPAHGLSLHNVSYGTLNIDWKDAAEQARSKDGLQGGRNKQYE